MVVGGKAVAAVHRHNTVLNGEGRGEGVHLAEVVHLAGVRGEDSLRAAHHAAAFHGAEGPSGVRRLEEEDREEDWRREGRPEVVHHAVEDPGEGSRRPGDP